MMITGFKWKEAAADKDHGRGVAEQGAEWSGAERSGFAELRREREEVAKMSLSALLYYVLMGDGRVPG